MKSPLSTLFSLLILSCAASATWAQSTPQIDQRQAKQAERIAKGQATGQISNQEAARLNAGQAKVAGMEAAAKADGVVTKEERKAIHKEQNKQSRHINAQKHDGNRR